MLKNISIIGGDLRIANLVHMLKKEKWNITTYGLEKADIQWDTTCVEATSLEEAVEKSSLLVSAIPLSSNGKTINSPFSEHPIYLEELLSRVGKKTLIAGNIKEKMIEEIQNNGGEVIDLLKQEELTILNTIATAEGAIQIAMEETARTIHSSNVLVLGFGRVGKVVADRLQGLGAHVACEARKKSDLAWIKAYGYDPIDLQQLDENLYKYTILINTIPSMILDETRIQLLNHEAVVIDLASYPGGVDKEAAKKHHIKYIWALSLPGKVAPTTSAEYIKQTLYTIIEQRKM